MPPPSLSLFIFSFLFQCFKLSWPTRASPYIGLARVPLLQYRVGQTRLARLGLGWIFKTWSVVIETKNKVTENKLSVTAIHILLFSHLWEWKHWRTNKQRPELAFLLFIQVPSKSRPPQNRITSPLQIIYNFVLLITCTIEYFWKRGC